MKHPRTIQRLTSPLGLPVSLAEAKAHLRLSGSEQDDLVRLLIESAAEQLERDIDQAVIASSWKQSQSEFPCGGEPLELIKGPIGSITSIEYYDEDNALQTWDAANYELNAETRTVFCLNADGWPTTQTDIDKYNVFVTFLCGVSDASEVSRYIKQAILLNVGRTFYDPAQENQVNSNDGKAYELLVTKLMRTSYP